MSLNIYDPGNEVLSFENILPGIFVENMQVMENPDTNTGTDSDTTKPTTSLTEPTPSIPATSNALERSIEVYNTDQKGSLLHNQIDISSNVLQSDRDLLPSNLPAPNEQPTKNADGEEIPHEERVQEVNQVNQNKLRTPVSPISTWPEFLAEQSDQAFTTLAPTNSAKQKTLASTIQQKDHRHLLYERIEVCQSQENAEEIEVKTKSYGCESSQGQTKRFALCTDLLMSGESMLRSSQADGTSILMNQRLPQKSKICFSPTEATTVCSKSKRKTNNATKSQSNLAGTPQYKINFHPSKERVSHQVKKLKQDFDEYLSD